MVLKQGLPPVIDCVAEHSKGVNVTEFATAVSEDVLGGQVVQQRVSVDRLTRVPLTKLKGGLKQTLRLINQMYTCI